MRLSPLVVPIAAITLTLALHAPMQPAEAGGGPVGGTVEIVAEADSTVDALVPFPFQGLSPSLAVGHDPSFGATSRSYLRFHLKNRENEEASGLIPGARIVGARLRFLSTFAVGSTQVLAHRSSVDDWPENGINFANQPGFSGGSLGSAVVSGAGPGQQSVTIPMSGWDTRLDRFSPDQKVTFVLKAPETSPTGTVNFSSIQGGSGPVLVLDMRARGAISNGEFDNGLAGFGTSGSVAVVPDPNDPGNNVAQLTTTSPAVLTQVVDTPDSLYVIAFVSRFLTTTGSLLVFDQNGGFLGTINAPQDEPEEDFQEHYFIVTDREARNRNDNTISLRFDGPAGSRVLLDSLEMFTIPEPELSVTASASGENVVVSYPTEPGAYYHLERSTDLVSWTRHGRWINGLDFIYEETIPVDAINGKEFFRLVISLDDYSSQLDIPNHQFEESALSDNQNVNVVPEWTTTPGAGAWNPPASVYPDEAPEGDNIAFANNGHSLRQTLDTVLLEPHYLYSLVVNVGRRPDIGFPDTSPPNIELRAGGVSLAPYLVYEESPVPPTGGFEYWARDYVIGPDHPAIGQPIEIVLSGGVSQGVVSQVNFENVLLFVE